MSLTEGEHVFAGLHEDGLNDFLTAFSARPRHLNYGSNAFVPLTTASETNMPSIAFPNVAGGIEWAVSFRIPHIDLFEDSSGGGMPPKFHNYSFNNQLLIFLERPDATRVAGFNRWKSMGRFVKKGEKGIQIFAPCKYKQKDESQQSDSPTSHGHLGSSSDSDRGPTTQVIKGFRVVHVFDISQTEGEPLDDLDAVRPKLLDGAAPEGIWEALVAQANAASFEVIRDRKGKENGYCDFLNKKIAVRRDVSEAQALKTLVHELGHALLHADDPPKTAAVAEVEVESVAYIVCDALGLDTGNYSFPYVTTMTPRVSCIRQSGRGACPRLRARPAWATGGQPPA